MHVLQKMENAGADGEQRSLLYARHQDTALPVLLTEGISGVSPHASYFTGCTFPLLYVRSLYVWWALCPPRPPARGPPGLQGSPGRPRSAPRPAGWLGVSRPTLTPSRAAPARWSLASLYAVTSTEGNLPCAGCILVGADAGSILKVSQLTKWPTSRPGHVSKLEKNCKTGHTTSLYVNLKQIRSVLRDEGTHSSHHVWLCTGGWSWRP